MKGDFRKVKPFKDKIWLSSPTMHGDEQRFVDEAIRTNWVSTVGENVDEVEKLTRSGGNMPLRWHQEPLRCTFPSALRVRGSTVLRLLTGEYWKAEGYFART